MRILNVGLLQFGAVKDKDKNLRKIRELIKNSSADLLILPEYSMGSITGMSPEELRSYAEPLDGPFVQSLSKLAKEHSVYLVAGIFESVEKGVYNTAVIIKPNGDLIGNYRKVHLFDAYGYRESEYFLSGEEVPPVIDIGKAKLGVAICFDIRFPELFRILALKGAEIVALPTAWFRGPLKEETLKFLMRARAHENTVYMAAAVQYSQEFTGRSILVDPAGVVTADLGVGEKYLEVPINIDYIYEVRKYLPLLELRKPLIYALSPDFHKQ